MKTAKFVQKTRCCFPEEPSEGDPFHTKLHELSRKLSTLSPATFEIERAKNKNLENVDDADGVCSGHSTSR